MKRQMVSKFLALLAAFAFAAGCAAPAQQAKSPVEAAAVSKVSSVSGEDLPDRVRVKIEGSTPLAFTVFRLSEPLRIVVDLADADVGGLAKEIPVSLGNVGTIRPVQFDEQAGRIGRLEIGLTESWDYSTSREGNAILVDFLKPNGPAPGEPEVKPLVQVAEPASAPPGGEATAGQPAAPVAEVPVAAVPASAEATAGKPADEAAPAPVEAPVPPPAPLAPARFVNRVSFLEERGGLTVELIADGALGNYDTIKIKAPNRIVLDLWGVAKGFKPTVIPVDSSGLKQIRVGDYPKEGKVRFVLDLSSAEFPSSEIRKLGDRLAVYLGQKDVPPSAAASASAPAGAMADRTAGQPAPEAVPAAPATEPLGENVATRTPSGAQPATGLSVTDIVYLPADRGGKVVITGTGKIPYTVNQPDPGRLVLELPGVILPKKLVRSQDTREKGGVLASLGSFNPRDGGGARVSMSFPAETAFDVAAEEGVLTVALTAPASAPPSGGAAAGKPVEVAAVKPAEAAPKGPAEVPAAIGTPAPAMPETAAAPAPVPSEGWTAADKPAAESPAARPLPAAADKKVALPGVKGGHFSGERVTLDFQDADVKNVLRLIAEVSGLNIITSDQVGGTISMRMVDVPWDQALDVILKTKGLGMVKEGNVIRIASLGQLEAEKAADIKSREMSRKVEDLSLKIVGLSYAKGEEIVPQLAPFLSERGSINVDKRTSSLIIKDLAPNIESVQKLIVELDIPTPQVRIEARIVIVDEAYSRSLGIKWGGAYQAGQTNIFGNNGAADASFGGGNFLVNLPASNPTGVLGVSFGTVGNFSNLDLRLSAMEQANKGKIISSPSLLVVENQQANIEVNNPFPENRTSTSTSDTGTTNTTSVSFPNLWTKLKITPHVTANKDIFMDVYVEKDSKGAQAIFDQNTFTGVNTHSLTTKIVIKNHGTAVIGGLFTESSKDGKSGIPFLSKVPVLGLLFQNKTEDKTREEMLIFINASVMEA